MSTVAIQIFTGAYPSIGHDITINFYAETDPLAIVATLTHPAPHLADTWSFPGLDRVNYLFRIFETNAGTILQQLAGDMYVVPASIGGVATRATEQIQADVTPGFTSGVNVVTLDGTSGAPDWRGWEIGTLNRMGPYGDMKKGVGLDYTWNKATGQLLLQTAGDLFGPNEWFNVDFEDQITDTSSSVPVNLPLFTTPKIKTVNYTIGAGDFGGVLIADPAALYMEFQLPDIDTVVSGRVLTLEFRRSSTNKCAKILTATSQIIDWLRGSRNDLLFCPNESLSIYKFIDPSGPTSMWRIWQPFGNWLKVGEQVSDDTIPDNVFNKILLDGGSIDIEQFARLYNDYVALLPGSQVVNYDDWATGPNLHYFSLANSSNPANVGKFHVPNRQNNFERITDGVRLPGDFQDHAILRHRHDSLTGAISGSPNGTNPAVRAVGKYGGPLNTVTDLSGYPCSDIGGLLPNVGTETRPANIAIRKYLYV